MEKQKKKFKTSTLFFCAGVLCFAVPGLYELMHIPWANLADENANDIVMREPSPLAVDYVDYGDIQQHPLSYTALPHPTLSPERALVLPGDDVSISEAPAVAPLSDPADIVSVSGALPDAPSPVKLPAPAPSVVIPKYVRLGAVKIPRIDVSENLVEGSTNNIFDYGIGHVEGTALPGGEGNSVVAAHRVSNVGMEPFRYLDRVENGDTVTVDFNGATYSYEVFESFIVAKEDVWVMSPVESETHMLTLITCDPLVYPGNRPDRLIVRARLAKPENNIGVE